MIYLVGSDLEFQGVKTLKLNEISFAKFSVDLSEFDALVITSKNAIKALEKNAISLSKNLQIYAIGEASTRAAREFGFEKIYTGKNSHGREFAEEILPFVKGKKTIYLSAKKTISNLGEILSAAGVLLTHIIAYENIALKADLSLKPDKKSVIVFTAPSAVKNFIANFGWDDSYKAVAIGKTTEFELRDFTKAIVSGKQDINSCLALAKTLL